MSEHYVWSPDVPLEYNPQWMQEILLQLITDLTLSRNQQVDEWHVAPTKPSTGMIVLADGTDWNPGSGRGFYGYDGASWRFLG